MPIHAQHEALKLWNTLENKQQHGRPLAQARFPHLPYDPLNTDSESRTTHTQQLIDGTTHKKLAEHQAKFQARLPSQFQAQTFTATSGARLILNASGGVIENGNLSLDRHSGVPFIPSTALKGCARRQGIWDLSQETDRCKAAKLLAKLSLLFGFGDQDWKPGRRPKDNRAYSDFWLAMLPLSEAIILAENFENWSKADQERLQEQDKQRNERWKTIAHEAQQILLNTLPLKQQYQDKPFLTQLQGAIAFLPAYPVNGHATLEKDIVTSHHPKYYRNEDGKDPTLTSGEQALIATDDEDPIPIVFPVIKAGASFQFTTHLTKPTLNLPDDLPKVASALLREGLTTFGIGAKTNAGYGWFEQPDKEIIQEVHPAPERDQEFLEKFKQLSENEIKSQYKFFGYDTKLWKEKDRNKQYTILLHIKEHLPALTTTRNGKKATLNLEQKFDLSTDD